MRSPSRDPRTQPVPSISAWADGSASTANTASGAASIVVDAVTRSVAIPVRRRAGPELIERQLRHFGGTQPPPTKWMGNSGRGGSDLQPRSRRARLGPFGGLVSRRACCETRNPDPGNWTFCRSGAVDFMLGRCAEAVAASELGDHSYVAYLRVDDVEAFHDRAVNAGAEILKPPTDEPWGMREFGVRSPDGHRFMLGQPAPS